MKVFFYSIAVPVIYAASKTTENTQKQGGLANYSMFILIAAMIVIFYFLLIRPQRKQAQKHQEMISKIERGDKVVTIGGIHGEVKKKTEDAVVLEVDKGVRITFSKSAIARNLTEPAEEEEEEGHEEEGEKGKEEDEA
ncbi:MAG: preprotein translocase subunit YajC [Actinomycetota bacterium]|nr:preprotein translocase subunit YajC [Actinomycetota bacterium]